MKTRLVSVPLARQPADGWLLFAFQDEPVPVPGSDPVSRRLDRMLKDWRARHDFIGKLNQVAVISSWESLPARSIVLAGLGKKKDFHVARFRQAAAAAAHTLRKHRLATLAVSLRAPDLPLAPELLAGHLAAALHYGHYAFTRYLTKDEDGPDRRMPDILFTDAPVRAPALARRLADTVAASEILKEVRDLANLPANEAAPAALAGAARALARKHGLACRVMDKAALQRKGCGALLAVGRGSRHEPRLIILRYPGTDRKLRPVALVGKTITFDTGGISIKPGKGMEWMKYDKCGGMAVLAAVLMAARLRLPRPVIALLPAAENMPGGDATRPGDIIRSYSGQTIEILNTDAEGRLLLADALSLAAEYKPAAIVDLATLTGASVVALGHVLSAVMGNRPEIVEQLRQAGETSGERLWPLPLLPEYDEDIKGAFSDLKNVGERGAGTIIGGTFLRHFVPESIPWAHLDIANTAYEESTKPYAPAGPTLFGARLLVEWLRNL
ncbi:MAG TPA: leucyl aminopeptidase [Kiritimatiellia bacterium]|nr:leucyl aminopeptidase [Kiritimatiellia bacterium]HRZ13724.1 leucyl aminopeptidase [Kiritimatiellia bacterium]HSA19368.1 leucyl aminopeptidase [Kiritimatiellia bacterium]